MPRIAMRRPMRSGPAARVMIVMPSGMSMPPPRPWTTRAPMSMPIDGAKAHRTEPATKKAMAMRYRRLVPKRSAAHPVSGMTVARASV